MPTNKPFAAYRQRHRGRWVLATLVFVVVALIALRFLWLPAYVVRTLNRHLAEMGPYRGQLADVDLHLWRGAYNIHELNIVKRDGEVPVPLLHAPLIDLSISWNALLHGRLVGEVMFHRPQLNFVDGRGEGADGGGDGQVGKGVDWRQQLEALFPLQLNQVCVDDGTLAFRNFQATPPLNVQATEVEACARNLSNVVDAQGKRDATLNAHARVLGQAPLELKAQADPLGKLDDFTLDLRVRDIELKRLNGLTRHYGKIDVAGGRGDFVMELEAREGALRGYAKPIMNDLDIFDWKQDVEQDHDNPLRVLWEGFVGGLTAIFKNHPKDRFATRIAIEGRIDRPDISRWEAISNILHNAFVHAYEARFETFGNEDAAGKRDDKD